jgi:hypothetical protein
VIRRRARRRFVPALALVLAAVIAPVALPLAAVGAAEELDHGWWWAGRPSETVLVALDPVPEVPEGGLYVSSDPSGPTGVSALRMELDDGAADLVLTLEIDDSVGTPLIDACPASTSWKAADGGSWDQRPQPDCGRARVTGEPSDDGSSLVFYLDPLLQGSTLDIVLTPGKPSDAVVAPAFGTAFKAPSAQAIAAGVPGASDGDASPEAFADAGADAGAGSYSSYDSSGLYASYASPALEPLPDVAVVAPEARATAAARASGRAVPAASIPVVGGADGFQYAAVLLLPLLLLGGSVYVGWALTRPVMVPTLVRVGGRRAI